jgi:UDP:flavonoid glycosyltransferase YjiC (YdhE family)
MWDHITITPTPLAIENTDGTPSYLGGWSPSASKMHVFRDFIGRTVTRAAKLTLSLPFRAQLEKVGIKIYRRDGTESIYSNHSTLGLGMLELEFPRSWPSYFKMIGPVLFCPERNIKLDLMRLSTKPLVLVTAGTHVWWAKRRLAADTEQLRKEIPDVHFVYSLGDSHNVQEHPLEHNDEHSVFPYIPYDQHLGQFRAVLHHGGSGVMYSCIDQGIPALVRPLDYDQFDYAARIEHHRLGIRVKAYDSHKAIQGLRKILNQPTEFAVKEFQQMLKHYSPLESVAMEAHRLMNQSTTR